MSDKRTGKKKKQIKPPAPESPVTIGQAPVIPKKINNPTPPKKQR